MSAPTVAVAWLLARAAVRATGRLHVVSRRDTDSLNPLCGANPIRSARIETHTTVPADVALCPDCTDLVDRLRTTVAALLDPAATASTVQLVDVDVDAIAAPPARRTAAADEPDVAFELLVDSVRQNGVTQPIVVRRTRAGLELVSGGRRLAAARAAGRPTVPTLIRAIDEQQAVVDRLLENLHRAELNPIEQGEAFAAALEQLDVDKTALAAGLGVSRSHVSNTIRLLGLPEHLREHVADRTLTAEQGRALLACDSEAAQDALADQLLAHARVRRSSGRAAAPDAQLAAIADLLTQVLEAKVAVRTRGATTEIVLRVPTAERDRVLAQLTPAA